MKWLKLDCDFGNDPKIRAVARKWGGQEAAGFWTLLLAFVGAHGGAECRVKIDPSTEFDEHYLASWFSSKPQVITSRLSTVAQLSLICRTEWETNRVIFIPNMLKRVDDYTRKVRTRSGQSPQIPHTEEEIEEEVEVEREEEISKSAALCALLSDGFERLWTRYPVKDGRKEAERHFSVSVKTEQDLTDIDVALTKYLEHIKRNDWKRPKNGKTWFNNWRDWIHWVEPPESQNGKSSGDRKALAFSGAPAYRPKQ